MVYPFYSRHKDFMPKGSLTVATNCRYCNKPHGMKAGAETHSAWMPREFPNYSCRIFVPFSFINDRSSFHFYYFVPPICETAPTVRQSDILHLSGEHPERWRMTICRRTSTKGMALANGIRDATVTYMLSTNAIPFVKLLVWLLRSFTPTHIFYIRFSSSFYNPWFTLL